MTHNPISTPISLSHLFRLRRDERWMMLVVALLLVAALGGSAGAWLGMRLWHHKTLHWKFRLGLPLILVVQLVVAVWWLGS